MNVVDTNVLLYAHDPRDRAKQAVAASLVESLADGVLLWQVACEYLAASRKLEPLGYSLLQAAQDIRDLRRVWTTLLPNWAVLDHAAQLCKTRSLSFWDAMIIAACLEGNVPRLYSEDLEGMDGLGGLEIVNPFKSA